MSEQVRALVVLHGDRANIDELPRWAADAHVIIAADGGAEHLLNAGISPDVVTGDFDGLNPAVKANLPSQILEPNGDQNTTDCQKALALATGKFKATSIVVFAAEGSRIDHMLSTLGACAALGVTVRAVFGSAIAHFVKPGTKFVAKTTVGLTVSLIPVVPARISSTAGLRWPADGLEMALGVLDGVSNEATGNEVSIEVESGCLAVFVGRFESDIRW